MQIATIGLDIAKNVFQVHGIDATEKVVVRKQLRRGQMLAFFKTLPPCLVGMEACATSHYWARELTKLGHQAGADAGERREGLRQAQQERCRRRRGDLRSGTAADHAFCADQIGQAAGSVDNSSRARPFHAAADPTDQCLAGAYGGARHCGAQGREGVKELLKIIASERCTFAGRCHASLVVLAAGLRALQTMIGSIEKRIVAQHRSNDASKRLRSIPEIGIVGATAIAATVPDRRHSAGVATLRPGSGWPGRIRLAANRSSGQSRNKATNI